MRILVRDEARRLYRGVVDDWVAAAAACEFQTVHAAALKANEDTALTTSVVLACEESGCELALNPDYCVERPRSWHVRA
ncbi:MAG TPA: hypothetical protein PKI20_11085 [Verrucomicrobiota bacterium]|jgi:hypothetical protein|nr:hypothetical protein [Verrucomicrobiota bacterium]HQL78136.1 hypothetical protein [Verrucomicrobiota bacterium]